MIGALGFVGESYIDGSVLVGAASGLFFLGSVIYALWTRQKRLRRDVYGSDDDDTRHGLLVETRDGFGHLEERLDAIEEKHDERLAEMERERKEEHRNVEQRLTYIADRLDAEQPLSRPDVADPRDGDSNAWADGQDDNRD